MSLPYTDWSARANIPAVWNRNTLQLIHDFPFHTGPVNCLSVRSDGQMFVSASGDGTIMLWDLNKCQLVRKLWQGTPGLACIAYTVRVTASKSTFTDCLQAEGLIYFGGSDRKFNALDVASGEIIKDLRGHEDLVRTLVIKPELQRLVSGSYDQDVRVCSRLCGGMGADPNPDLGPEE